MKPLILKTPRGERSIGPESSVFIVAELSANHCGSYERAVRIIGAAAECGVDAIKIQTYTPDTLTIDCDKEWFQIKVNEAWAGKTLYQLYQSAYTPWEWHSALKNYAESLGLVFFSSPFDETAVDFLEALDVPLYKAASFVTSHLPLLEKIGRTGKPVILSRGLTNLDELTVAVQTLKQYGCPHVAILHCVSSYPATPDQIHLKTIPDLIKRFDAVVGLSDHTLSPAVPIAAVALGASILEKHFTLSREEGGADAAFSLEPDEMKALVAAIRETELALGVATYVSDIREEANRVFQTSVFVVDNIGKGEVFTKENIRIIRPGYGLKPRFYRELLGKRAICNLERGMPMEWKYVE